jgi:hypothetical protein
MSIPNAKTESDSEFVRTHAQRNDKQTTAVALSKIQKCILAGAILLWGASLFLSSINFLADIATTPILSSAAVKFTNAVAASTCSFSIVFAGIPFCRTIQISHAGDNADPQNGRLPALDVSAGWAIGSSSDVLAKFTERKKQHDP